MKKVVRMLGLCALVALAFTSCKKKETGSTITFKATMPQTVSDSRTHMDESQYVVWDDNDKICVINDDASDYINSVVKTIDTYGTGATFEGDAAFLGDITTDGMYYAFYPTTYNTKGEPTVSMTIPASQTFKAKSFDTNLYPMFAANEGTGFQFRSDAGLLTIPITKGQETQNSFTVGRIVVEAYNHEDELVGTMTYAHNAPNMSNPTYTKSNTSYTVELTGCDLLGEIGVDDRQFNFVLMEGALTGEFKVTLYDPLDNIIPILDANNTPHDFIVGSTPRGIIAQQRIRMNPITLR